MFFIYFIINFKSAFDTIWRDAMWSMLKKIGLSDKIVTILKALYHYTECAVVIESGISECFRVDLGMRQGCLLSITLLMSSSN